MSNDDKLLNINISIDGVTHTVSIDEAKRIYKRLKKIFKKRNKTSTYEPIQIITEPDKNIYPKASDTWVVMLDNQPYKTSSILAT